MGKRKAQGVLIPDVATIEDFTRDLGHGRFAIKHDGRFGPAKVEHFMGAPDGREQQHRNWGSGRRVVGEMNSWTEFTVSEMESRLSPEFHRNQVVADLARPVGEMITTGQGAMDLLEKVRLDIDVGLADVPLLYQPLFERVDGPFPGGAVQIGGDVLFDANVIFQQKFEAGEIIFGTLTKAGAPSFVPITTFAAGFEWTEDILEFDRSYEIGMNARAFGRAYNYLLNHNHLSPIIAATYTGTNAIAADATAGEGIQAHTLRTFQAAYRTGALAVPQRVPTVILANEADRFQIEDALLTPVLDAAGNQLRRVPVDTIIYYNGATVTNGVVSQTYPGVTAGTCYFIAPRMRMKELVHHDLRVDVGPGDVTRLIAGQQVARARRGLYADLNNSVEKITLPTS
jgi:hypothetical protein